MLRWLINNREWVFSGVGISAIGLIAAAFKWRRSAQSPPIIQSPQITQAPSVQITNNVGSPVDLPQKLEKTTQSRDVNDKPSIQTPLFSVNPAVASRDLSSFTGSPGDSNTTVCIARFRMSEPLMNEIGTRFEASVDYNERLSASGWPFDHRAGHVNQALWLPSNNGSQELILAVKKGESLFATRSPESKHSSERNNLLELDLRSKIVFATVTLIDLSNGQKWQAEYEIEQDFHEQTMNIRETQCLLRHGPIY